MKIGLINLALDLYQRGIFTNLDSLLDMGTKELRVSYRDLENSLNQVNISLKHKKYNILKKFPKVTLISHETFYKIISLANKYKVVGFDENKLRIKTLRNGDDFNNEFKKRDLKKKHLIFTHQKANLNDYNIFFLTIPIPLNNKNITDLNLIRKAT